MILARTLLDTVAIFVHTFLDTIAILAHTVLNTVTILATTLLDTTVTLTHTLLDTTDLGLQVDLGVPVGVIENDHISCGEVDAQTSGASGQHEEKFLTTFAIKLINELLGGGTQGS